MQQIFYGEYQFCLQMYYMKWQFLNCAAVSLNLLHFKVKISVCDIFSVECDYVDQNGILLYFILEKEPCLRRHSC